MQGSNPGLPHCRQIRYHLSSCRKGSSYSTTEQLMILFTSWKLINIKRETFLHTKKIQIALSPLPLFALNIFWCLNYVIDGLIQENQTGVLIFLKLCIKEVFSKQGFISGSMKADAWLFVLAMTYSWRKKRIICKLFQASLRCSWARGGKCMISTELAWLTRTMEGVSLSGLEWLQWSFRSRVWYD